MTHQNNKAIDKKEIDLIKTIFGFLLLLRFPNKQKNALKRSSWPHNEDVIKISLEIATQSTLEMWYRSKDFFAQNFQKCKNQFNREATTTENMVELCETIWWTMQTNLSFELSSGQKNDSNKQQYYQQWQKCTIC